LHDVLAFLLICAESFEFIANQCGQRLGTDTEQTVRAEGGFEILGKANTALQTLARNATAAEASEEGIFG
jgi:hypothetical protein